jgi:hypothetical protein
MNYSVTTGSGATSTASKPITAEAALQKAVEYEALMFPNVRILNAAGQEYDVGRLRRFIESSKFRGAG